MSCLHASYECLTLFAPFLARGKFASLGSLAPTPELGNWITNVWAVANKQSGGSLDMTFVIGSPLKSINVSCPSCYGVRSINYSVHVT